LNVYDKYSKLLFEDYETSFLKVFNAEWTNFIHNLQLEYGNSKQIHIGNRLRPTLCCWGYLYNKDPFSEIDFSSIAKVAVSVEAIHKASVIIDDIIDGDEKRRGEKCLHVEYSNDEATFFSVCLLVASIKNINEQFANKKVVSLREEVVSVLCNTIVEMCTGALKEITISNKDMIDIRQINEIISLETVALLRNSLLLGYWTAETSNPAIESTLKMVGEKCAYIFQVMNDLEPFCNPDYIESHKGKMNSDCFRSRKSIVIPYLYANAQKKDKEYIKSIIGAESNWEELLRMFQKYAVRRLILDEVDEIKNSIYGLLSNIESGSTNLMWLECFPIFVSKLISYCESILDGTPNEWQQYRFI